MPIAKGSIYLKKILVHGVKCMGHYCKNRSGNCFANMKFSIFFLPLHKTASKFCASITEELQLVSITVVDDYIFQKYKIFLVDFVFLLWHSSPFQIPICILLYVCCISFHLLTFMFTNCILSIHHSSVVTVHMGVQHHTLLRDS